MYFVIVVFMVTYPHYHYTTITTYCQGIITFIFDYLLHLAVTGFLKLFTPDDPEMNWHWFPSAMHALFVVIIGLISWPIFRSRLSVLYKAIYMTVPLAVVFVTIGIFLFPWSVLAYSVASLFFVGVLEYLYRTKQPWLYYYTLILVAFVMLIAGLLGIEI